MSRKGIANFWRVVGKRIEEAEREPKTILIEGDYTIIKATSAPAIDGLATLVHIEAAHVIFMGKGLKSDEFLGHIMIDTSKASIYAAVVDATAGYNKRLRVRIELVTETE